MSDATNPQLPCTLHKIADRWWLVLLRGLLAILFGCLAFLWPGLTLLTLVIFYGAFALADGVLAIGAAISGRGRSAARWWLVFSGVLGILVGVLTFAWPGITAVVLLLFIAGWSIAMGVMEIVAAIQLRKEIEHEWLLILNGVVLILFGAALLLWPAAGLLALAWMIASFAVVSGVIYVAWAFRLRAVRGTTPPAAPQAA